MRKIHWNNILYLVLMYLCIYGAFEAKQTVLKSGFVLGILFFHELFARTKEGE